MKRKLTAIIAGAGAVTATIVMMVGGSSEVPGELLDSEGVEVIVTYVPPSTIPIVQAPELPGTSSTSPLQTTSSTTTTTLPPQPVTLLFTGDVLVHPAVAKQAEASGGGEYDFTPMFAEVAPVIRAADLAICHLETPLDPQSGSPRGFPRFSTPAEIATALAVAGFDGCSTASNHVLDRGIIGVAETLDVLDEAGLRHTGSARGPEERDGEIYVVGDIVVGHLSYSYTGFGQLRSDEQWATNGLDADNILADAQALRDRGADFVVVSLHWGIEFQYTPSWQQVNLGNVLTESPLVDLIVGHHAHRLQQVEVVNGKYVFYGLGNFLSNQEPSCCGEVAQEGAMILVRLTESDGDWSIDEVKYVPTFVDRHNGYVILPTLGPDVAEHRWSDWLIRSSVRVGTSLKLDDSGLSIAEACGWMGKDCPSESG